MIQSALGKKLLSYKCQSFVECDSVEILIHLDGVESIENSLQSELLSSWHSLKLKIQKERKEKRD